MDIEEELIIGENEAGWSTQEESEDEVNRNAYMEKFNTYDADMKKLEDEVNRNVNAELKRMTKLGDERETELLKRNHDLRRIAKRNKRRNMRAMQRMSSRFQVTHDMYYAISCGPRLYH